MEQILNEIRLYYTDTEINQLIRSQNESEIDYTRHYNQNEEFFLNLGKEFVVPSFPIHHDIKVKTPTQKYLLPLKNFLHELIPLIPLVFHGLMYYFDPGEILRPCFFQVYTLRDMMFLYLLRLDLVFRTQDCVIIERGTNDQTCRYKTHHLFLEADLLPLDGVDIVDGKVKAFKVKQTISQTWIGETGRGYFVQGIWMDHELTKFFSKLFIPKGKRIYPYYPFTCKFRTICHTLLNHSVEGRKKHVNRLQKAMDFILPEIESIQAALKNVEFSETLPYFQNLKARVPLFWESEWASLGVQPYLNQLDMKEFRIEYH
ncbi:MAG: hypothetical protein AB1798_09760 [Spirochaetota bacterium]